MFSLLGMENGGFAKGKGMSGEYNMPAAPPIPSMPAAPVATPSPRAFSPSPQAASMGANFGSQEGQPSLSPAAVTEAGKLGAGIGAATPSPATGGFGGGGAVKILIDATGGTIEDIGDQRGHTFTSSGVFDVTAIDAGLPAPAKAVDYVVVAGGGAGGYSWGAGGGAGGFREAHVEAISGPYTASPIASATSIPITATGYPVTIGAGGGQTNSPPACGCQGTPGSTTTFSTISSSGGGGGGGGHQNPGLPGGSGGAGGLQVFTSVEVAPEDTFAVSIGGGGGGGGIGAPPPNPGKILICVTFCKVDMELYQYRQV